MPAESIVVNGYRVRLQHHGGWWIGDCPTVGVVAQEATREAALAAIEDDIPEMIGALADLGEPVPPRDVLCPAN